MGLPADHMAELRRGAFPIPLAGEFSDQERELLSRYGYWLMALATGAISPITPEQDRFVHVAKGEAEPRSAFELVWAKYQWTAKPDDSRGDPCALGDLFARLESARFEEATAQDAYASNRDAILEQVRPLLEALEFEFGDRLRSMSEVLVRLQSEVREAVLAFGASFKHSGLNATYSRGRISWDTSGLTRYMDSHPEVAKFKRVGKPWVSLRFQPLEENSPSEEQSREMQTKQAMESQHEQRDATKSPPR